MADRTQGLLSNPLFMAGMGLLGSNQWGGGLQGLLAANQSRMADQQWQAEEADRQMRQQVQQMQLSQAQRQEAARSQLTAAMQSGDTQGALAALAELSPETMAGKMFAQNKPVTLSAGEMLVGPDGKVITQAPFKPDTLSPEALAQREQLARLRGGAGAAGYFTPQATEAGLGSFNNRTGQLEIITGPDGQPIMPAQFSAPLQGEVASAKEAGKTTGGARAQAALDAPQAVATAEEMLSNLSAVKNHPGKAFGVGFSSLAPVIPGTARADFVTRMDQIKGGAFLKAYETLKGGGQITEVEGKKATDAIARLSTSQSEPEFDKALEDFMSVIRGVRERALAKARGAPVSAGAESRPGVVDFGSLQ